MPKIVHSGQYWADYHRRRAACLAHADEQRSSHSENTFPPLHDQAPIYNLDRTRPIVTIGTVQTNGGIVWRPLTSAPAAAAAPPSPPSTITSALAVAADVYNRPARRIAAKAAAILRSRPSDDEQLLARLKEDPDARRHRQFREEYRAMIPPIQRPRGTEHWAKLKADAAKKYKGKQEVYVHPSV
ncbi:hypothetical protein C8R43DRAFT_942280 [Mycena crocata]|nr:hypothetical protein C8R43DRAFT_942280 [Mycena crocata]